MYWSPIEPGFQRQLKTGVVFVDRQVFLGNQSNRWRRLNNGLPPGSALAPILFNQCMSDLSSSSLNLLQYVDDIALTHQARKFEECEIHLEKGLKILSRFFHEWRLRPNPSETEMCVFHLGTNDANRKWTVQFDHTLITHVDHPKYLGITMDWTFSHKPHLEKTGATSRRLEWDVRRPCSVNWRIAVHMVDHFCSTNYKLSVRYGFDQDLSYEQLTLVPCKMATVSWIVGENHSCQMFRWMVILSMTLLLFLLDLTLNVENG
jgi:hypothetical protein